MAKRLLFLVLICIAAQDIAEAQSFYNVTRRNRNLLVNVGSGIANYKGEMVNPGEFGIIRPNFTAGAEYYWTRRISTRAQFTYFVIGGDDKNANDDRWQRNLSFTSGVFEFSAVGILNLSPQGDRYYQRPKINIHGFAGIGMFYFNPKAELDGKKYALQPLMTENEKYSRIQPCIPLGLGARFVVNPFFNILIEGGYRITFTDYLDDISKKRYVSYDQLGGDANSIRARLSDRRVEIGTTPGKNLPDLEAEEARTTKGVRGNPEENDGYFILNVSLQYYLPREIFKQYSYRKLYTTKRKGYYRRPRR